MYLATNIIHGKRQYFIRQSILQDGMYVSRELMELGPEPSVYIVYPGGRSFYIDESVENVLNTKLSEWDYQELEDIFWAFIRPDIRRSVGCFRRRGFAGRKNSSLTRDESDFIRDRLHIIDKRRYNYLRTGELDQAKQGNIPEKFYRTLVFKSRDELEQLFLNMESRLEPSEYSLYVYSFLYLRRFFSEISAGRMPQALDQDKLEKLCIREICDLNQYDTFLQGIDSSPGLHPYLQRYLFMFFDFPFGPDSSLNDYFRAFYHRSRQRFGTHHAPVRKFSSHEVTEVMGISRDELSAMSKIQITRLFRRLAMKTHPDRGGDHDKFIKLMEVYHHILAGK